MELNKNQLKNSLGIFFVTSHIFILFVVYVLFLNKKITEEVFFSILVSLGPLLTTYSGMIVRDLTMDAPIDNTIVSKSRFYISFLIPIGTFLIISLIIFFQYNEARFTSATISKILAGVDAVLGLYLGIIIRGLFTK